MILQLPQRQLEDALRTPRLARPLGQATDKVWLFHALEINFYRARMLCIFSRYRKHSLGLSRGAEDVLQTLFFNPHRYSDLRALSNGITCESPDGDEDDDIGTPSPAGAQAVSSVVDRSITWKGEQREILDTCCGNREGLKLEFRLRRKGAGWKFHDRFLIFPKEEGGALAWSLGTSVNSLGSSHHILQKVSNGELVKNAFLSLWDCLGEDDYKVWEAR